MTTFASPGSISYGTLRPQDLLNTFANTLAGLTDGGADHAALIEEALGLATAIDLAGSEHNDVSSEVINELSDALDAYSPAGYYFGVHEGDGADFGWWAVETDDGDDGDDGEPVADPHGGNYYMEMLAVNGMSPVETDDTATPIVYDADIAVDVAALPEDVRGAILACGFRPTADAGGMWYFDRPLEGGTSLRLLFGEDGSDLPDSMDDVVMVSTMPSTDTADPPAEGEWKVLAEITYPTLREALADVGKTHGYPMD